MGFVPLNGETMQMLEKSPQSGLSSRSNIAHCLAPATISDADRDADRLWVTLLSNSIYSISGYFFLVASNPSLFSLTNF
jgi:hypothetical protein